jgi:hypothetical protein
VYPPGVPRQRATSAANAGADCCSAGAQPTMMRLCLARVSATFRRQASAAGGHQQQPSAVGRLSSTRRASSSSSNYSTIGCTRKTRKQQGSRTKQRQAGPAAACGNLRQRLPGG